MILRIVTILEQSSTIGKKPSVSMTRLVFVANTHRGEIFYPEWDRL
ncbi:MAG: hypothetical protein KJ063_13130 [Anaerolineae bacterium]|nr:hypothetical protein [Anaerolineae bacterium]